MTTARAVDRVPAGTPPPGTNVGADILSQLPTYPDGNMMEAAAPHVTLGIARFDRQHTGGSFGDDGALVQRFPVRTSGRRL